MFWPRLNEIDLMILMKHFQDFKIVNVFSVLRHYFPFKEGVILHLNRLESPSPTNALCQVRLNLAGGSLEDIENVKSLLTDIQMDRRRTTYD